MRRLLRLVGYRPPVVRRLERLCQQAQAEEQAAGQALGEGMTYAKRVDGTHAEVRDTLRRLGCAVVDLSRVGSGVPDLLVAATWLPPVLVEVKAAKGKLRETQEAFHATWPGRCVILRSATEAVQWIRQERAA